MIEFACHNCGKRFSVSSSYAGRKANCKNCGEPVVVPLPPARQMPPATASAKDKSPAANPFEKRQNRSTTENNSSAVRENAAQEKKTVNQGEIPATNKVPVRIRRLRADADQMNQVFTNFGPIRLKSMAGDPPDTYVIEYRIRGLALGNDSVPVFRNQHLVEIQLTRDYPHYSPKCRMLTPVFHPNIEPAVICVGDHWTASERLTDLVIRIGEMLAFQAFNIKSPLDGEAAMWTDLNRNKLPTDKVDLHPPNLT